MGFWGRTARHRREPAGELRTAPPVATTRRVLHPEFTCVCPKTGFPDFATLNVRYVPGPRCVELKSLKLYINGFRDRGVFHEDAVNGILDDLVALLDPRYCEVVGDFNVRGNIKTVVTAVHRGDGWAEEPDPWWEANRDR